MMLLAMGLFVHQHWATLLLPKRQAFHNRGRNSPSDYPSKLCESAYAGDKLDLICSWNRILGMPEAFQVDLPCQIDTTSCLGLGSMFFHWSLGCDVYCCSSGFCKLWSGVCYQARPCCCCCCCCSSMDNVCVRFIDCLSRLHYHY
jgi:hypothetical protein